MSMKSIKMAVIKKTIFVFWFMPKSDDCCLIRSLWKRKKKKGDGVNSLWRVFEGEILRYHKMQMSGNNSTSPTFQWGGGSRRYMAPKWNTLSAFISDWKLVLKKMRINKESVNKDFVWWDSETSDKLQKNLTIFFFIHKWLIWIIHT